MAHRFPSFMSMVVAWVTIAIADVLWDRALFNYDGEYGDAAPPDFADTLANGALGATVVVGLALVLRRLFDRRGLPFWFALFGAAIITGCVLAVIPLTAQKFYGPASAYTFGHFYRGAAISILTNVFNGVAAGGLVWLVGRTGRRSRRRSLRMHH